MTKLKTLKDIGYYIHSVRRDDLKKEAIKWVKHWKGLDFTKMTDNTAAFIEGKISATILLNNISEEDLKDG